MRSMMLAALMMLLAGPAFAQESPATTGDQATKPEQAQAQAEAEAVTAAKEDEFKPPPGYLQKKRGDKVLYCKKSTETGSRFATEKCYDEAQIRDVELMKEQNNRDFDQRRAICSNPGICAPT
jgi:hypothetical protein